ncbi:MAG: AAA family ATPase, partial [Candidatus Aenigmarchaeota archaeon]|nr:AAA family ATPase [Candidatus Aenigmarchaeota archaeon]
MEFVNRQEELKTLEEYKHFSKSRLFSLVIYGQRRIGKTTLVKHFCNNKEHIYFFVYEHKSQKALLDEFEEELKRNKIIEPYSKIQNWDDFVEILFDKCKNKIIIFDEFQNFRQVNPAIYSVLQKKFDENKDNPIFFIFLSSVIGLIKTVFEDMKAPLYGRIKAKIKLDAMDYSNARKMMKALRYTKEEDFIEFYSLFGGIPKYYTAIEDFNLEKKPLLDVIEYFFLKQNAPFDYEILDILRQEFGGKKSTYYTILEAIATGHTKLNEISTYIGMNMTSIARYIDDLIFYYEFIERICPITENPKNSKRTIYRLKNPVMNFWFRYIHRHLTLFEGKNYKYIKEEISKDKNNFIGRATETIVTQYLRQLNKKNKLPLDFTHIGNWWHKDKEIDIVAFNSNANKIMFCEVKYRNKK